MTLLVAIALWLLFLQAISICCATPHSRTLGISDMYVIPSQNVLECTLQCQNNGTCLIRRHQYHNQGQQDQHLQSWQKRASSVLSHQCLCLPGFGGLSCEIPMTACFHKFGNDFYCQAESTCVRNRVLTGEEKFCNCQLANPISAFAGLDCGYSATEYCTKDGSISLAAFCTNQGVCRSYIDNDSSDTQRQDHPGCNCTSEFTGSHCEYIKGMVPSLEESTPAENASMWTSMQGLSTAVIVLIILGLSLLACLIGRWWCKANYGDLDQDYDFEFEEGEEA